MRLSTDSLAGMVLWYWRKGASQGPCLPQSSQVSCSGSLPSVGPVWMRYEVALGGVGRYEKNVLGQRGACAEAVRSGELLVHLIAQEAHQGSVGGEGRAAGGAPLMEILEGCLSDEKPVLQR